MYHGEPCCRTMVNPVVEGDKVCTMENPVVEGDKVCT